MIKRKFDLLNFYCLANLSKFASVPSAQCMVIMTQGIADEDKDFFIMLNATVFS